MRPGLRPLTVSVAAAPAVLAVLPAGCPAAAPPRHAVAITVRPQTSLADQAVRFQVTGLAAGELASIQVTSTDAAGVRWRATSQPK